MILCKWQFLCFYIIFLIIHLKTLQYPIIPKISTVTPAKAELGPQSKPAFTSRKSATKAAPAVPKQKAPAPSQKMPDKPPETRKKMERNHQKSRPKKPPDPNQLIMKKYEKNRTAAAEAKDRSMRLNHQPFVE